MTLEEELKQKIVEKEKELASIESETKLRETSIKKEIIKESELVIKKVQSELKQAQRKLLYAVQQLKKSQKNNNVQGSLLQKQEVDKLTATTKKLMILIDALTKEKERHVMAKLKEMLNEKATKIKKVRSEIKDVYKELLALKNPHLVNDN